MKRRLTGGRGDPRRCGAALGEEAASVTVDKRAGRRRVGVGEGKGERRCACAGWSSSSSAGDTGPRRRRRPTWA
ncbi:hypothetical protein GUJ93_ZPchr0012g22140 [Zizania palustris]|uniref:Uncharacterized protein n=1 Tax=Zizania palustris TaxID=103762 RepID=A0A8J5WRU2_ZIZPA|nr:hypothetical protein GUJ93_ZPchr0012g22140 [Zizania palustris]